MALDHLVDAGMMEPGVREQLVDLVRARKNLVVAGATGAGKTTLLNALVMQVPSGERVISIEETPELRLTGRHAVSLITRAASIEGKGAVDPSELLRAALRMRPDRIVVGEVRGAEALVALSAFSTGHEGSMVTLHARSPAGVAPRLVSLALQSDAAPSEEALCEQVRSAFDAVVFVARRGGRRAVTAVCPMT
jgi:pilus assembly protein CpaF